MKTVAVLIAFQLSEWAKFRNFGGKNAVELCVDWAKSCKSCEKIAVLCDAESAEELAAFCGVAETIAIGDDSAKTLISAISNAATGFDAAIVAFADCPFLDAETTAEILDAHFRYSADFSFAQGWPDGFAPEVASPSLLSRLQAPNCSGTTRFSLFRLIEPNVNDFEIEMIRAENDLRHLRLSLSCGTKRDWELCKALFAICDEDRSLRICDVLQNENLLPKILACPPSFYNFQIAAKCSGGCTFCPYPAWFEAKFGKNPKNADEKMSLDNFKNVLAKIADYSDDAVIGLSLWGEATSRPEFCKFVEAALQFPKFRLLVETSGDFVSEDLAKSVKTVVERAEKRCGGAEPISWIVSIDAAKSETYRELHDCDGFENAKNAWRILAKYFPNDVYAQFLRMKDSEAELREFWQEWTEITPNVIVEKYDDFCRRLPDEKCVDLSPAKRVPCFHARRDMNILFDGTVPICREIGFDYAAGNAISDDFAKICGKIHETLSAKNFEYLKFCERCDEYYTVNF